MELKVALDLEVKEKKKDELVVKVIERLCEKLNIEKAISKAVNELKCAHS